MKEELERRFQEWRTQIENFEILKKIIDDNYYQYEPLIKYLENEDRLKTDRSVKEPAHHVDKDIHQFKMKLEEIREGMSKVEGLYSNKMLEEILSMLPLLIYFQQYYEKDLKYLSNLSD